jgi:4-hydroxybenzoate polyprenyltransferase
VINSINKFFASKKAGLAMALLASAMALSSLLSFLPFNLRNDLRALCIGFAIVLIPFTRAYSDDWNRHKPWGKEFLSKAFFTVFVLFGLIIFTIVLKDFIPHLK